MKSYEMKSLEQYDKKFVRWQKNHPKLNNILIIILIITIVLLFIPLMIIFTIGYILHNTFYTGCIYKKVDGKPRKTWM